MRVVTCSSSAALPRICLPARVVHCRERHYKPITRGRGRDSREDDEHLSFLSWTWDMQVFKQPSFGITHIERQLAAGRDGGTWETLFARPITE